MSLNDIEQILTDSILDNEQNIGIVFAKEIKDFVLDIIPLGSEREEHHLYGREYVEIKENKYKVKMQGVMKLSELETLLGVKFLKNDKVKNDTMINY